MSEGGRKRGREREWEKVREREREGGSKGGREKWREAQRGKGSETWHSTITHSVPVCATQSHGARR